MKIITTDDFKDVLIKGTQKGWPFILSKFNFSAEKRTKSAFGKTIGKGVNWWQIPYVQQRWNCKITNDYNKNYLSFLKDDFLKNRKGLKLISVGSGICKPEIELAKTTIFDHITCVELSKVLTNRANKSIKENGLNNIEVICKNIYDFSFEKEKYDIVFFKSSLHHFKNIEFLLRTQILKCLKKNGYLIIDEFVGPDRLQYPKKQLKAVNSALKYIPRKYKKVCGLPLYKGRVSGPGVIRMILADPSECIESSKIISSIHKHFDTVIEKPFGGNILAIVLKDIAHHFYELSSEKKHVLDQLFKFEDEYLKENTSNFVFGIYTPKREN